MQSRLGPDSLAALPAEVQRPHYDRQAVSCGIVHLGIGAFMRAHLAAATEAVLNGGDLRWGIVGVSLRQPGTRDALEPQQGLYTLALQTGGAQQALQVMGVVQQVLLAPLETERVLACMCAEQTRIISLTVTEKGYCYDTAHGRLRRDHPDIAHDIAHPRSPRSAIGFIVAALSRRQALGRGGLSLMSLDNLPANGRVLSQAVIALATAQNEALADWITRECSFPSSMVDRIVPRTTPADREAVAAAIGCDDAWPVLAEPFFDWAVEDRFVKGRPDWRLGGARFVPDSAPWERLKLRMVNGAHSSVAYLGVLAGWKTVNEAVGHAPLRLHLESLWKDEIEPTLEPLPGLDHAAYRQQLLDRFANPTLKHHTMQIAADGSQKLPQRLLAPVQERLRSGRPVRRLSLGVAAWLMYLGGVNEQGQEFAIDDPWADALQPLARHAIANDFGEAGLRPLLAFRPVFGDLGRQPAFFKAVQEGLHSLHREGVENTLLRE